VLFLMRMPFGSSVALDARRRAGASGSAIRRAQQQRVILTTAEAIPPPDASADHITEGHECGCFVDVFLPGRKSKRHEDGTIGDLIGSWHGLSEHQCQLPTTA
jgi:hypothetical protein